MPVKYRRNCDWCGQRYHGEGKHFCSQACYVDASKAPDPDRPPTKASEKIHRQLGPDGGSIYVEASQQIRSHEDLIERAGIDVDEWDIVSHPIRTWSVPIKVADEIHVVQMYYVGLTLKPALKRRWDIKPLVISVPRPATRRGAMATDTTVHYSDVHIPYADPQAIGVLFDVLADVSPGHVICHGDLLDCEQISRFPKDPNRRTSTKDETRMGGEHLGEVTAITPNAKHDFLEGNHEDRVRRLVWKMADDRAVGELLHLDGVQKALSWPSLLGLESLGWGFTPYGEHLLLRDRLVCAHGESVRKHSAYSAKSEHDAYRKSGASGHTHRMGSYYHTGYDGQVQAWHELGCLCVLGLGYIKRPPNWQQGFAVVTWDGDRYAWEHIGIHQGRAIFRGKSYGASAA